VSWIDEKRATDPYGAPHSGVKILRGGGVPWPGPERRRGWCCHVSMCIWEYLRVYRYRVALHNVHAVCSAPDSCW